MVRGGICIFLLIMTPYFILFVVGIKQIGGTARPELIHIMGSEMEEGDQNQ